MADYNTMKGQLGAVARKSGGSLAVRDINTVVKPNQVVESENMTTAFVVVAKYSHKDWDLSYEKMCNFVVREPCAWHACACARNDHAWPLGPACIRAVQSGCPQQITCMQHVRALQ